MPSALYNRKYVQNGYYYIYHKSSGGKELFRDEDDYLNFVKTFQYYLTSPTGKPLSQTKKEDLTQTPSHIQLSFRILLFVLLPKSIHILIRQNTPPQTNNNITNLMRRLSITYSMYYKNRYDTHESLFDGKYKNINIPDNEKLLYLSKHIHRMPLDLYPQETLEKYIYSSYPFYIGVAGKPDWLDTKIISDILLRSSPGLGYKNFVENSHLGKDLDKKYIVNGG
ncbi:MAG TPA: hypothetical protein VI819_02490 [Patescibacteria group bacterium]|nr:hypothetical protein [Patescibacteria group bacterium]